MSHFDRRNFIRASTGVALSSVYANPFQVQAADPTAIVSVKLPIPPRFQWDELDGYCGECSIQQAALAYGTYVSQYVCRGIININQRSQLLVAVNDQTVLTALRLTSTAWDYNRSANPQFQAYYGWVKQHLSLFHPVLIVAYAQGLADPDYDHIMLASGFSSTDTTTYHATDQFLFNDNYSTVVLNRTASTLTDTRRMRGNGALNEFCIPTNVCYGTAITGILDTSKLALPVQVLLNTQSEPDVITGASPVMFNASVSISGLTVGKSYSLYRYNDYRNVPTINYAASKYSAVVNFIATKTTYSVAATIASNTIATFRCLPAGK
ncbi:MAG: hypothetical protein NT172_08795 [Planctomycetota bacterium]|nr:hypothetical protein [Planctomycetota bacterium]